MGKRRVNEKKGFHKICFTFLFVFSMIFSVKPAGAAIFVEQVNSKAPGVKAYVQGNVNQNSKFKGKITGTDKNGNTASIALVQDGETKSASTDDGTVKYVFLLDNSESVNEAQFGAMKNCLADFRKSLAKRAQDKMSVYTVGVRDAGRRYEAVLESASGGGVSSDVKKIRSIKRNGKKTVLYRTINEITGRTKSSKERVILVILTDGEDDSTGSRNHPSTTLENVKNAQIPVYGVLLNYGLSGSGDVEKIQVTKKILNTEGSNDRMVRGIDVSGNSSASAAEKAFGNLMERIQTKTVLVKLKADTNRTLTNTKLTLTKTNGTVEEAKVKEFNYSDHVPDQEPPKVSDLKVEAGNQLSIIISDDNGLDEPSLLNQANYKVYHVENNSAAGKGISVKKTEIPSSEDGKKKKKVLLTLERELEDGDYVLKLSGLKDASEEGNIIDHMEISFGMYEGVPGDQEKSDGTADISGSESSSGAESLENKNDGKVVAFSFWWIVIPVLLIIILILLVLLLKKKKQKPAEPQWYGDWKSEADTCLINLTVTDGKGFTKDLQWDVEGSFFVGRSEICEVFFDDEMLSKQHFVIEVTKQGCFIEDLGSLNGTYINGILIKGRVELFEGNEIQAGKERFLVQSFRKGFDPVGTTSPV